MPLLDPELLGALAAAADREPETLRALLDGVRGDEARQLDALVRAGLLSLERAYEVWAGELGLGFHRLEPRHLDPRLLHRLPIDIARRYGAIVVDDRDGVLSVVLRDPFDIIAVDAIQDVTGMAVQVLMSTPVALERALERLERGRTGIEGLIVRIQKAEVDLATVSDADKLRTAVGDDAVIQLLDYVIEAALRCKASDIHVEPARDSLRVRVRIDGELDTIHTFPPGLHRALVARIKVLAGMDIGESRRPQDGRFQVSEHVEMRVSVLPSVLGEKAVLRVLDRGNVDLSPERLDMSAANHELFRRGYTAPNGMVLLSGPTGSGKTTTLYTAMSDLNREDVNLITVEDPVEYEMAGTTQVQVDDKAGRTFAKALRSILRQDPDVIMVGEIRDAETAAIAVQAALTGHMVLSTLHTNDAVGAVHRLVDMGVAPYLLGPALRCVVGQRLVPRVCSRCAAPAPPTGAVLAAFGLDPGSDPRGFVRGRGCRDCRNRGRAGRIAIHEVMCVTGPMAHLISRGATEEELAGAAATAGYRRMLLDGLEKARRGLVTLEDVLAVARGQ